MQPKPNSPITPVPAAEGFYQGGTYWNIDESIGYLVRKLANSFQRHIDAKMQARGLTHSQWGPLLLIANGKGDTASALARELGVDTGATTRMVDRLEAKGLLKRGWCELDRRVVRLKLTEQGRAVTESVPDCLAEVLNHHLRGFTREEVLQMKSNLRRMLENGRDTFPEPIIEP
jgi:DNA-binding MarR family transcriptional regulator